MNWSHGRNIDEITVLNLQSQINKSLLSKAFKTKLIISWTLCQINLGFVNIYIVCDTERYLISYFLIKSAIIHS